MKALCRSYYSQYGTTKDFPYWQMMKDEYKLRTKKQLEEKFYQLIGYKADKTMTAASRKQLRTAASKREYKSLMELLKQKNKESTVQRLKELDCMSTVTRLKKPDISPKVVRVLEAYCKFLETMSSDVAYISGSSYYLGSIATMIKLDEEMFIANLDSSAQIAAEVLSPYLTPDIYPKSPIFRVTKGLITTPDDLSKDDIKFIHKSMLSHFLTRSQTVPQTVFTFVMNNVSSIHDMSDEDYLKFVDYAEFMGTTISGLVEMCGIQLPDALSSYESLGKLAVIKGTDNVVMYSVDGNHKVRLSRTMFLRIAEAGLVEDSLWSESTGDFCLVTDAGGVEPLKDLYGKPPAKNDFGGFE